MISSGLWIIHASYFESSFFPVEAQHTWLPNVWPGELSHLFTVHVAEPLHCFPRRHRSRFALKEALLNCGLPLEAIPVPKLESGRDRPACGLTEAERRAVHRLAARWLVRGRSVAERGVWPDGVVQRGLRTPTGLAFVGFCIDGIRGLASAFSCMRRSTRLVVLFSVAR
jgi:hypothetical protein